MKKISPLTRRFIFKVMRDGFKSPYDGSLLTMDPFGERGELEFLNDVFDLKNIPSTDGRFADAYGDVWQHRINNYDWEEYWFINDSRFNLSEDSEDEPLLKFLSAIFDPSIRDEESPWKEFLDKYNELLSHDGYQLVPKKQISGYDVYGPQFTDVVQIERKGEIETYDLKVIGSGSYANVFSYEDNHYGKFALKRLNKHATPKDLERFEREYDVMLNLDSPHILKVYSYDPDKKEYIMEYMDDNLLHYIETNNDKLSIDERTAIIEQIFTAIRYIHSRELLHRDISPKNMLIKKYDDGSVIVKLSDFGLVKVQDSDLTSANSDVKGSMHDPDLEKIGFSNYNLDHEIYSLTWLVLFILTGKRSHLNVTDLEFTELKKYGMGDSKDRYKSLELLHDDVQKCIKRLKDCN